MWARVTMAGSQPAFEGSPQCEVGHRVDAAFRGVQQGNWARWSWDGLRLSASVDPLGMRPLFYAVEGATCTVSSSLAEIAPLIGAKPDAKALAVFEFLGFFLGERTALRGVNVLPPMGSLTWDRGQTRVGGGAWVSAETPTTPDAAVDRFLELSRQSIRRRLPDSDRWSMPMSGGRDSRYILFLLEEAGCKPPACVTTEQYPPRSNIDCEVAAEVCAALGVEHVRVRAMPRLAAEIAKNRLTHFACDEHAWFMSAAEELRRRGAIAYDGLGADTLTGHWLRMPWRAACEGGRLDEVAEALCPAGSGWPHVPGLLPEVRSVTLDEIRHDVVQHLSLWKGHHNPVTAFMFWNRTRREIAMMSAGILGDIRSHTPLVDAELVEFLSGVPTEILGVNALHDLALERGFPQWKGLRRAPYRTRQSAALHNASLVTSVMAWAAGQGGFETAALLSWARMMATGGDKGKAGRRHRSLARLVLRLQMRRELGLRESAAQRRAA